MTDGYIDLALMVYDSEDDPEAKLVGEGPAIHHFGIEVEDTAAFIAKIQANGGTILENEPGDAIKYRAPDGTVSEIAEVGRYEKMKGKVCRVCRFHRSPGASAGTLVSRR